MATSTDGTGTAPEAGSPAGSVRPAANDAPHPAVALLSNGRYGVMVTAAGAGYSTWRGLDVTRWREDATRDCWGQFCYARDLTDDRIWSIGLQPLCRAGGEYQYEFHADRAEFRRRDGDVETRWAVCVAPDADAEVRAVTLVNHGSRPREVELTSYAEVCLNHRRADQAHPAFAKLFLETEFDPGSGSLLARRRPRSANENPVWAIHRSATGRRGERTHRVRDGPGAIPRARPHPGQSRRPGPRREPVADDRPGAGSGLQLAAPRSPRAGGAGAHRVRDRGGRHPGGGAGDRRTVPRPRGHRSGIRRRQDPLSRRAAGDVADAGRRRPLRSPGGGRRLHEPRTPAARGRGREPPGTTGVVAPCDLGRPAHRAGPGRGGRR